MTYLETQVLEQLRTLPADKQHEVLEFVEFLVARTKKQLSSGASSLIPDAPPTLAMQTDQFSTAQRLRESIQVQGQSLSASIIQQRTEARY